jgi:hypothetical protein
VLTARDFSGASRAELLAFAERGTHVDPDTLAGHVYNGISLGLPAWLVRLTWTKFGKVFHRDRSGGPVRGWNLRIEQDGLDRPWRPRRRAGRQMTFGHFVVDAARDHLLLDYGAGGNARLDPISALRDPIVALDGPRLLLGWSYLELAGTRVATPSYFVLERAEANVEPVDPPRSR